MTTREFCRFLEETADDADRKLNTSKSRDDTALPDSTICRIRDCIESNHIANETLHEIRHNPFLYHADPYRFLWMLHRYMNRYWNP